MILGLLIWCCYRSRVEIEWETFIEVLNVFSAVKLFALSTLKKKNQFFCIKSFDENVGLISFDAVGKTQTEMNVSIAMKLDEVNHEKQDCIKILDSRIFWRDNRLFASTFCSFAANCRYLCDVADNRADKKSFFSSRYWNLSDLPDFECRDFIKFLVFSHQ